MRSLFSKLAFTAIVAAAFTNAQTFTTTAVACTSTPIPSAPACAGQPTGYLGNFNDGCSPSWNYTVYCMMDLTQPSSVTTGATTTIQCMQNCDGYQLCVGAVWNGAQCYLLMSNAFPTSNGVYPKNTTSNLVAFIRYKWPNPLWTPVSAPGTNTSSGCGLALPPNLTPDGPGQGYWAINPTDGYNRSWTIHIPRLYNTNAASPLILAFPGNGDMSSDIEKETLLSISNYNPYGVVAYAQGVSNGFESNPAYAPGQTYGAVDDISYVTNLIANVTASFCIDTGRIFATGMSNGGGFVNVLACDPVLSVKIAAFAPHSGAFYTNQSNANFQGNLNTFEPLNTPVQPVCSPGRNNVPIFELHGNGDATINYTGSSTHGTNLLPSIPHWTTDWAIRQGYGSSNYTFATPYPNVIGYQFGGANGSLGIVQHYMIGNNWGHYFATVYGGAPLDSISPIMDFFYNWTDPHRAAQYTPPQATITTTSGASGATSTCPAFVTLTTTVTVSASSSTCPAFVTSTITVTSTAAGAGATMFDANGLRKGWLDSNHSGAVA